MDGCAGGSIDFPEGRVCDVSFRLRAGLVPLGVTWDPHNLNERQKQCHSPQHALPCLGLGQDE